MPEQDKPTQVIGIEPQDTKLINFTIKIDSPDTYIYSNVAGVSISPWDIRINFADVNVTDEGQEQVFKAVTGVVMPPEHAAGLVMLLTGQLKQYESQFGEIRYPPWQAMKARNAARAAKMAEEPQSPKTEG